MLVWVANDRWAVVIGKLLLVKAALEAKAREARGAKAAADRADASHMVEKRALEAVVNFMVENNNDLCVSFRGKDQRARHTRNRRGKTPTYVSLAAIVT